MKKLGILGGMGPEATAYFFYKIVSMTNAQSDENHIEIFIHNNTKIPDRTASILSKRRSPLEELLRSARILEEAGADLIVMPCMTAHHYIQLLQEKIDTPILNAIELCGNYIAEKEPPIRNVGILATTGTIKSALFQDTLLRYGISSIVPQDALQQGLVMESIYGLRGIKAGYKDEEVKKKLIEAGQNLIERGADVIIAGCTEIPLVIGNEEVSVPFIDPMEILAQVAIQKCS